MIGIKLTSTIVSIIIQEEISWTRTLIAPFCVLTIILTSSIVDIAFIDLCKNHKKAIIKCRVIGKYSGISLTGTSRVPHGKFQLLKVINFNKSISKVIVANP